MATSVCALTQDYSFGCDVGAGGLIDIWLIEQGNVSSVTESSGTLTAITKVAGKIFRHYQLVLETSSQEETITSNRQNGTVAYDQKVTMIINKQQVAVRNEILLLAKNTLCLVVQDQNGTYRYYGRINGLRLASGSIASGTALADRNGYTLSFEGKEADPAPFVQSSVIATLQT